MPKLVVGGFAGVVPRTTARMLRESEAQAADNVRLYKGELMTWLGPQLVYTPELANAQTIFRLRNSFADTTAWLVWDKSVNVTRSPSADTSDIRVYYTGDGEPKKTNWLLATSGAGDSPHDWLHMGVPAPTTAPTVATTTGSAAAEDSRYYVYTYVSEFGLLEEESAPSPASALVTVAISQSANISAFAAPPTVGYNITKIRIYRTLTGEESAGVYAFVGEVEVADLPATFNDDKTAAELGESLATVGWAPPPTDMQGIVSMANGMLAGFSSNTVYFCEPYFPHAWPTRYAQTVPDMIVGLGAFGNTLVVMTEGHTHLMVGVSPETISVEKLPLPEPCVSAASIASDHFGVVYASPNGLVAIGPGVADVITKNLFRRDEWQEYDPHTLKGAVYDGKYFGAFQSSLHGTRTMVLSRDDHPALSYLDVYAGALHTDNNASELFYFEPGDSVIYRFNADALQPMIYEWKSKRFQFPKAITFSALKLSVDTQQQDRNTLYLELIEELKAQNNLLFPEDLQGELNASELNTYQINGDILHDLPRMADTLTATVILFGERGEQEAVLSVDTLDPVRIPPFKSREIEVKLTGTLNVSMLAMATTVAELHE